MTRLRLSLRQRLLLLVLLALLPTLAVIGYNELNLRRSRTQEVNEQALRSALLATSELQRIFEGVDKLLLAIGQIPEIQALNAEACGSYLVNLQPKVEHLVGIAVVDAEGDLRCRTVMPSLPVNYADRGYVQEALQSGRFAIGEFLTGRVSGRPVLPVAQPFKDPSGRLIGAILAGIDLRWLADRLRERGLPPGGALTVADRTGVIISREPLSDRFVGTKIPQDFMRLVHGAGPGAETVLSQDGTQRILGYVPVASSGVGLYVSAGLSYENSFAAIERGSRIGLVIALGGGLIAFLAAWLAGQRVLQRPIEKLVDVLEAWRGGDREARTHYRAEDGEIGALGAALDRLMDEIVQRQGERELLVHELDHRVKNNFAVIHSVASRTLRTAGVDPAVIRKLGDRIVALSRAHDLLTRENFESATVQELVEGAIATQTPECDARIWRSGPVVRLDPRASLGLAMALHELLTNAVKYGALSGESGRVTLTWVLEPHGQGTACLFQWEEFGGPPVEAPSARGFGSQLLERSVQGAQFDFRREGLLCGFRLDVSRPREREPAPGAMAATA
ncbi:MAG: HWE histidine kinase domain-containing protein [Alsobacter sp.]